MSVFTFVRRQCSRCSSKVEHLDPAELVAAVPRRDRPQLREYLALLGPHATAWRCTTCTEYGVSGTPSF